MAILKQIVLAAALLPAAFASSVNAETVDLATIKCSDIASMSDEEGAYFFVWLHGYFGGEAGDTTMDLSEMETAGKLIGEYCAANPDVGILSAARQALGE